MSITRILLMLSVVMGVSWRGLAGVDLSKGWKIVGPIPNAAYDEAAADRFIREDAVDVCGVKVTDYVNPRFGSGVFFADVWRDVSTDNSMACAAIEVDAAAGYYQFMFATDYAAEVFIDGKTVFKCDDISFGNVFFAELNAGMNRIAIRSRHISGNWAVVLQCVAGPFDEAGYAELLAQINQDKLLEDFSNNDLTIGGYFVGSTGARPELNWNDPDSAAKMLGDNQPEISWFDANMEPIDDFSRSGLYFALVEADLVDGNQFKRLLAYYLLPGDWRENPDILKIDAQYSRPDKKPLDTFKWHVAVFDINFYFKNGKRISREDTTCSLKPALAWRQRRFPVERLKLAPPRKLEKATPLLRAGSEAEAGFKPGAIEKIDALCAEWYEKTGVPFYTQIARDGVIIYDKGYGEIDGVPMAADTVCHLASISKNLTGMLFARFMDQKLMTLDEDMARLMPALKQAEPWKLTPRHCFMQASGFTGHGNFGGIFNVLGEYSAACRLPAARPGTQSHYNGVGYNMMGLYMMLATGKPIAELYEESYYRPLGIVDMVGNDQGGGYAASAADLAKFAQIMLNRGRYGEWEFFSEDTYHKMMPVPIAETFPGIVENESWFRSYGTGIHPFGAVAEFYGHGAASGVVYAFDPDRQLSVIQTRNEPGDQYDYYRDGLLRLVLDSVNE